MLPLYGGSLPIGRYCTAALRQLGHLVEVFEAPDFYPSYKALGALRVGTDRLQFLENSYTFRSFPRRFSPRWKPSSPILFWRRPKRRFPSRP